MDLGDAWKAFRIDGGGGVAHMASTLLGRAIDDSPEDRERAIRFLRGPVRDWLRADIEAHPERYLPPSDGTTPE